MTQLISDFQLAYISRNASQLGQCFNPFGDQYRTQAFFNFTNVVSAPVDVRRALTGSHAVPGFKLPKQALNTWIDVFVSYWAALGELNAANKYGGSWTKVFGAWRDLANTVIRGYTVGGLESWTIPCLYQIGKSLRLFAIKADADDRGDDDADGHDFQDDMVVDGGGNANLEEAARMINRMFTLCLQDRSPLESSRKWGVYSIVTLSFKTYFKLGSVSSCRSILNAIDATQFDMPPLEKFPKADIVTFKYYQGLLAFLEKNYAQAESHLSNAWRLCHTSAHKNRQLILTYLIPCRLVTSHTLPSRQLLQLFPRLEALFLPLCHRIKHGDLSGFDAAMAAGEHEFVKKRIYLPLESGRDIAMRNLFRKVFIAGGYDPAVDGQPAIRRTRVPVVEFAAAMRIGRDWTSPREADAGFDMDEVECYLANMIYQNLMKGYISRERSMVVLSKNNAAFPGTDV